MMIIIIINDLVMQRSFTLREHDFKHMKYFEFYFNNFLQKYFVNKISNCGNNGLHNLKFIGRILD